MNSMASMPRSRANAGPVARPVRSRRLASGQAHTSHGMSMSERQTGKATAQLRNPPAHVCGTRPYTCDPHEACARACGQRYRAADSTDGTHDAESPLPLPLASPRRPCLRALPAPPEREESARAVAAVAARRCRRAAAMLRHARHASTELPTNGSRVRPDGRTRMRPGANLDSGSWRRSSIELYGSSRDLSS